MSLAGNLVALAERIALAIQGKAGVDHPGLARAWVCFGVVDDELVIRAAYQVRAVEHLATGRYRVSFATTMPDADYCWTAFARNAGRQSALKFAAARVNAEAKTPEYVEVICATAAGTLADTSELNLMVFR